MRYFSRILLGLFIVATVCAQEEQAPITEKEIVYYDWTYKSIHSDLEQNLRNYTVGKKLVIVVYFAPWCHIWRHDGPMIQKLYDKYKDDGLGVIAVGLYDPVEAMKANLNTLKIRFPAVYESVDRDDKQRSLHYKYRQSTGDERIWGSPWYIFLNPSNMEKAGDILTRKASVINGSMIESEGEAFIRRQLELPAIDTKIGLRKNGKIEVCNPNNRIIGLIRP